MKSYREPTTTQVASTQLAQSHNTRTAWRDSALLHNTSRGAPSMGTAPAVLASSRLVITSRAHANYIVQTNARRDTNV
ncbi:hypothetical protein GCM10022236_06360 [Microlunatus ginsengisoli]|uniref:Uncharacterized protein n=1 Tax=Microlunatus ginsengisoli TaxID=363863 RepID=A0ABP6ZIK3_9ACTN